MLRASVRVSVHLNVLALASVWISSLDIRSIIANFVALSIHLCLIFTYISVVLVLHLLNLFIDCLIMFWRAVRLAITIVCWRRVRGFGRLIVVVD